MGRPNGYASTIEAFRRNAGPPRELDGVVESLDSLATTGSRLRGATRVVATVKLSSGPVVPASVSAGATISVGSHVTLQEYPQSFGSPRYTIVAPFANEP